MATYTLNATARNIINALQAGKSILVHTSSDLETYVAPSYISFNTANGSENFYMTVPMGFMGTNISFETSDFDIPLTYESGDSGGVM